MLYVFLYFAFGAATYSVAGIADTMKDENENEGDDLYTGEDAGQRLLSSLLYFVILISAVVYFCCPIKCWYMHCCFARSNGNEKQSIGSFFVDGPVPVVAEEDEDVPSKIQLAKTRYFIVRLYLLDFGGFILSVIAGNWQAVLFFSG